MSSETLSYNITFRIIYRLYDLGHTFIDLSIDNPIVVHYVTHKYKTLINHYSKHLTTRRLTLTVPYTHFIASLTSPVVDCRFLQIADSSYSPVGCEPVS